MTPVEHQGYVKAVEKHRKDVNAYTDVAAEQVDNGEKVASEILNLVCQCHSLETKHKLT